MLAPLLLKLLEWLMTPRNLLIVVVAGGAGGLYVRGNHYKSQRDKATTQVMQYETAIKQAELEKEILVQKLGVAGVLAASTNTAHREEARKILAEPIPTKPEDRQAYLEALLGKVKK